MTVTDKEYKPLHCARITEEKTLILSVNPSYENEAINAINAQDNKYIEDLIDKGLAKWIDFEDTKNN